MTDPEKTRRLLGVVPDNPRPADHHDDTSHPQADATYQSWLRRRVAALERQQQVRIKLTEQKKRELDETIRRKQTEIDNLKSQQTIGGVK